MINDFDGFVKIHEKRLMTKDVRIMERALSDTLNRASSVLGSIDTDLLNKSIIKINAGVDEFKTILAKNNIYDV